MTTKQTNFNPSVAIKDMEREILSDINFSQNLQSLLDHYDYTSFEANPKNYDGNYLKLKAFLLMIDGQYQEVLNLKSKFDVIIYKLIIILHRIKFLQKTTLKQS